MKAKYLKPAFLEKSDDVKLTFTVTADEAAQVFSLKRGESYEIAPYSQEVAKEVQSPQEKLEMAQRLISEALAEMGNSIEMDGHVEFILPLTVKKCCGTCAEWTETSVCDNTGLSEGDCAEYNMTTSDDNVDNCPKWREDK